LLRQLSCVIAVLCGITCLLNRASAIVIIPAIVLTAALSLSWNPLSLSAAADIGGEHHQGLAMGLQQTAISIAAALAPVTFASIVGAGSWRLGFATFTVYPLVAFTLLRRLEVPRHDFILD
jgi:MFS family permease